MEGRRPSPPPPVDPWTHEVKEESIAGCLSRLPVGGGYFRPNPEPDHPARHAVEGRGTIPVGPGMVVYQGRRSQRLLLGLPPVQGRL